MFFSDMSVKGAGFGPVMVEGELPDKATEKKKAKKSATEKLFFFIWEGKKVRRASFQDYAMGRLDSS